MITIINVIMPVNIKVNLVSTGVIVDESTLVDKFILADIDI
jgi:hypothetical protein